MSLLSEVLSVRLPRQNTSRKTCVVRPCILHDFVGYARRKHSGGSIVYGQIPGREDGGCENVAHFQNIKSVQLEETKKVESQCIRDEGGRLLRDKGRIRERWVRFFRSLLNSTSDMLDPDIPKKLPQQPLASALGIEPTEEEIATAMKAMAGRAFRGTAETRTPTRSDHPARVPPTHHPHLARGESPTAVERRGRYSTPQKVTRRIAETTAASRSCHTRVRLFLKWLPGDSALTVRRRDCYRRSSAGSDRIARPRA